VPALTTHDENYPEERCSLLQHYSSETVSHAGFLLTLGIILTAFVDFIRVLFPPTTVNFTYHVLVGFFLIPLTLAIIYLAGKFMCWGYLASSIMLVRPRNLSFSDADHEFLDETLILGRLHYGATQNVKREHPSLTIFVSGLKAYLRWPAPYVISFLVGVFYILIVYAWIVYVWIHSLCPYPC